MLNIVAVTNLLKKRIIGFVFLLGLHIPLAKMIIPLLQVICRPVSVLSKYYEVIMKVFKKYNWQFHLSQTPLCHWPPKFWQTQGSLI